MEISESIMFNLDHSEEYQVNNQKRIEENLFNKDKEILKESQKRKVIYGALEQQQRSLYQIMEPYLWKMVEGTGNLANQAGKGIYAALKMGAVWVYDKLTNNVVPYAVENIPKLIFIIKSRDNQKKYVSSQSFQVLEIDDEEFNEIKKNTNKGKKRVVIPLDAEPDQNLIKMLEKQNYVPDYSFPIDMDSQEIDQESFMIPSANFIVLHEQVKKRHEQEYQKSKEMKIVQEKQLEKMDENIPESKIQEINSHIFNPQIYYQNLDEFNKPKKYLKLKDCLIFEYQGKNSIEYDLLDNIERDENTQCGYLVEPKKMIESAISEESDQPYSGEAPLVVNEEVPQKRVRVEIPLQKLKQKEQQEQEEGQIYYA